MKRFMLCSLVAVSLPMGIAIAGDDPRLNGSDAAPVNAAPAPVFHVDKKNEIIEMYVPTAEVAALLEQNKLEKLETKEQRDRVLAVAVELIKRTGKRVEIFSKDGDPRLDSREASYYRGYGWRGYGGGYRGHVGYRPYYNHYYPQGRSYYGYRSIYRNNVYNNFNTYRYTGYRGYGNYYYNAPYLGSYAGYNGYFNRPWVDYGAVGYNDCNYLYAYNYTSSLGYQVATPGAVAYDNGNSDMWSFYNGDWNYNGG